MGMTQSLESHCLLHRVVARGLSLWKSRKFTGGHPSATPKFYKIMSEYYLAAKQFRLVERISGTTSQISMEETDIVSISCQLLACLPQRRFEYITSASRRLHALSLGIRVCS